MSDVNLHAEKCIVNVKNIKNLFGCLPLLEMERNACITYILVFYSLQMRFGFQYQILSNTRDRVNYGQIDLLPTDYTYLLP